MAQWVFGVGAPRLAGERLLQDSLRLLAPATERIDSSGEEATRSERELRREARRRRVAERALNDSLTPLSPADSLASADTTAQAPAVDSSKMPRPAGKFIDEPILGKNSDSLVYDVRNKLVYIYNQGDVSYQTSNLKADYMQIDLTTKLVHAYGKPDSVDGKWTSTKPEYTEGETSYRMDTITYHLDSGKAKIKGVATQQGDGWLVGGSVKKMTDNTINIENGKYTTCDHTDHPHFYLAMTKAKVIPGKKVITGPAYLVMEEVPIYFLGIPEGFFPISSGPKSGLLMPTFGEVFSKGFFLRDLGYFFTLG